MKAWLAALRKTAEGIPGGILGGWRRVRGKFPAITAWISRRRPRFWAWIYIVMVPLMGIVFWALPTGSFYDSNLTREAGYSHDLDTIASLLTSAIQDQEGLYPTPHRLTWNAGARRYTLGPTNTEVLTGTVAVDTSGRISFVISMFAQTSVNNHSASDAFFEVNVTLLAGTEAFTQFQNGPNQAGFTVSSTKDLDLDPPPLDIVLPRVSKDGIMPTASQSELWVPSSTVDVIFHLTDAANGNPEEASGLYIRMCYLSAVTITTLGFGDITPVSFSARALVGAEAVIGVVLVGLFLNAVAQKWGTGPVEKPKDGTG